MKIDTTDPRIPLNRLKHPLRQALSEEKKEDESIDIKAISSEDFEREVIRDGAKRFEEWLSEIGVE